MSRARLTGAPLVAAALLLWGCLGDFPRPAEGTFSGDRVFPTGTIAMEHDFATLRPGGGVELDGVVSCPESMAPCSYRWDFGNGEQSTAEDPGRVYYGPEGFYTVTFTVTNRFGVSDPKPARAHVAVWQGTFADDFDRAALDFDRDGYRRPLLLTEQPMYSVKGNQLRVTGSWGLPGSTAITAWPVVRNARVEVTKRRQPVATDAEGKPVEHYCDIILRGHPQGWSGSFYRVRVWEEVEPGPGNPQARGVELAVFKITSAGDQHGILISDPSQPPGTNPTVCQQCAYVPDVPRSQDLRVVVELWEKQIRARLSDPENPGTVLLTAVAEDSLPGPLLYAGAVGLTHFEGQSTFDDLRVQELTTPPSGMGGSGPPQP